MKSLQFTILLLVLAAVAGCRSRVVEVKLINTSGQPLSVIIVDYPTATFGVDKLDPGATYQYPIKVLGTGPLKVQFTDANGHNHSYTGPSLEKNDAGVVTVKLTQEAAAATSDVSRK
jgi:hypothetical protein